MEISNRKASKGKSHPRVPIKTYRWEDVRRSRKRGGYPWTYLYKQPLGDDMDPPSSTKRTETEQQRESSEWEELMLEEAEDIGDIRVLSDTPRHLKNSSSSLGVSGSLLDDKNRTPGIFFLDSAESSDDISQYLDRDDPLNIAERVDVETQVPKEAQDTIPEDTQKRKRTISQGSDHSKMSVSRSVMMKKLKDAKAKIKVPKLSIPTSKFRKTVPKKSSSPPKTQSSSQDKKADKEVTPVYIHIPLKPPPGETDEYSNLDSKGDPKHSQPKKLRSFKDAVKGIKHLYGDQKEIATISEEVTEDTSTTTPEDAQLLLTNENIVEIQPEKPEDIRNEETDVNGPMVDEIIRLSEKNKSKINDNDEPRIQGEKEARNQENLSEEILDHSDIHGPDKESPLHDDITENNDKPEHLDADTVQEGSSKQYNDMFDDLFKASTSVIKDDEEPRDRSMRSKSAEPERKRKMSLESAYSRKSLSKLGLLKKLKNASDKIKKAFSKPNLKQEKEETAIVAPKKHKEKKIDAPTAPVYIYIPLKDENADVEAKNPDEDTDDISTPEIDSKISGPGKVELIILTAPSDDEVLDYNSSDVPETPSSENKLFFGNKITELKELAKGAIDELSSKDKQKLRTVEEEIIVGSPQQEGTTPVEIDKTPSGPDGVELIMVTVPTDDELLDYDSSDVPETPTESKLVFELKELAKGAIATTSPVINDKIVNTSRVILPESKDHSSVGPTLQEEEPKISIEEPVQSTRDLIVVSTLVDEQDGLNETKVTMVFKKGDDEEDKVDSTLEVQTLSTPMEETPHSDERFGSPKLKKKVSFRKKARLMRDGSYEDVEIPQGSFEEKPTGVSAVAQDEVENKAAKLPLEEEEDNKWSKTSDHEYEPVNPPPEDFVMIPCSTMSQTSKTVTFPMDRPTEDRPYRPSPEPQAYPDSDDLDRTPTPEPETERISSMHRFQSEFKRKAQDLRGRFHAMKKPHISLPARPVFHKPNFKIDKSKFSFQHVKNKFPSLKQTAKRHHSTESNDGDAKRTIFSTYPRIFKRKPTEYCEETTDFATVPRSRTKPMSSDWSSGEPVRIPLHSEDSMEESYVKGESLEELGTPRIEYPEHEDFGYNGDSLGRWDRGTFSSEHQSQVVTDLDMPEEQPDVQSEYKEHYSSGSSNGLHRQGVLEEIDSDEFFLRQKGISQDNIEVGMYLSSEIRDAFRTPANALTQMQHPEYDLKGSAHSIPEVSAKRKPMKKPKRKKTPHVSQERIDSYEAESAEEDEEGVIPPRPKRNSRRCRKQKSPQEDLIPYQETISVEGPNDRMSEHRESLAVWGDDERDEEVIAHEDEEMVRKEQPDISVNDYVDGPVVPPRKQKSLKSLNFSENDSILGRDISDDGIPKLEAIRTESKVIIPIPAEVPERPTRSKSRSRMSLQYGKETQNENENAFANISDRNIPFADDVEQTFEKTIDHSHNYIGEPFISSRITIESAGRGNEKFFEKMIEPSFMKSDVAFTKNLQQQEPCVEEICKQDIRDCMGYAVVDKSKVRDPPLPPPRIPKRRKKPVKNGNNRFATIQGTTFHEKSPIRPLRNYSTLGQMRKQNQYNDNYEDEENIDITQYIEIDDATKKLQSGDVVQKMKDRPLPAPPRPPRKARPLHDISSEENIMIRHTGPYAEETEVSTQTEPLPDDFVCEEMVQEPTDTVIIPTERHKKRNKQLPDDLVSNEMLQQLTEIGLSPTERCKKLTEPSKEIEENVEKIPERQIDLQPDNSVMQEPSESTRRKREIQLITPTVFTHEETITHGSLLVEPLDGAEILPNQSERRIQVHVESDEEETSSIPEDFSKLSSPAEKLVITKESSGIDSPQPVQLKTLDIDTLKVNRLLADKIVVSELDAGMIKTNDISSESGSLQVTGLNLPPELIKEVILAIKSDRVEDHEAITAKDCEKTVEEVENETFPLVGDVIYDEGGETTIGNTTFDEGDRIQEEMPGSSRDLQQDPFTGDSITEVTCDKQSEPLPEQTEDKKQSNELRETISEVDNKAPPALEENYPPRPPRQAERIKCQHLREEPEVDDEPPPRPPEPQVAYLPSQPPASFYALRAERYVESVSDSVPLAPRRRRHTKVKHLSRSSSDESSTAALQRRRHRRSSSPSLTELSSTLLRVCGSEINVALRRLVTYVLTNVRQNDDGKQDLNVMMIVVLVMIAGLILLGYGEEKTVVHLHHWDYFNPPTNM